jgi:hypothetical protein
VGAGGGAFEISASGTITIGTGTNAAVLSAAGGFSAAGGNSTAGAGSGGGILLVSPAAPTFGTNGAARAHGGATGGVPGNAGLLGSDGTATNGQNGHTADNTAASGGTATNGTGIGGTNGVAGANGGLCAGSSCAVTANGVNGANSTVGGGGGGGRVVFTTGTAPNSCDSPPASPWNSITACGTTCANAVNCDDSNPCTIETCSSGACVHTPGNAGTACGSGQTSICEAQDYCDGVSATCPNTKATQGSDCGYTGTGYGGFIMYSGGAPGFNQGDNGTNGPNLSGFSSGNVSATNATSNLPFTWDANALKFTATSNSTGAAFAYWKAIGGNGATGNAPRVMAAADFVEYDVELATNIGGIGGIDIHNSDNTYWRDIVGWQDQNAVGGHPATDLTVKAYNKWYHRRLAVPASVVGKTIAYVDVVDENDTNSQAATVYYDNVMVSQIKGACDGAGTCKRKTGMACTAGTDCATGVCTTSVCQ